MEFVDWETEGLNEIFVGKLESWMQFFFQGSDVVLELNKLKTIGRFAGILTHFYLISRRIVPSDIVRVSRFPNKVSFFVIFEEYMNKLKDGRNRDIVRKIREITELIKEGKVETYQMILHKADDMGDSRRAVEELSISLKTSEGDNVRLSFGDMNYDVDFKAVGFDEFIQTFFRILCKIQGYCSTLPRLSKNHAVYFKVTLFDEHAVSETHLRNMTAEEIKFDYSGLSNIVLEETCLYRGKQDERRLASATLFRHRPIEDERVLQGVQDFLSEIIEEEKDKNPSKYIESSHFSDGSNSTPSPPKAKKRGRETNPPLEKRRVDDSIIGDEFDVETAIPRKDSGEQHEDITVTNQQVNRVIIQDRAMILTKGDTDGELDEIIGVLKGSKRNSRRSSVQVIKKGRGRPRK